MLGVTERTFRRWSTRYEADGVAGLEDRRLGRASARVVPVDERLEMVTLYESCFTGWTVKHFHERWHQAPWGDTLLYVNQEQAASSWPRRLCPPPLRSLQEAAPQTPTRY